MSVFADWQPAPNIGGHPEVYELENQALDPEGLVLDEMRRLAPWAGRDLLDLGCGTGYWLPGYATEATTVTGVEPDPTLIALARRRVEGVRHIEVLAGSAESVPLQDSSVDVVHARFAYFFGPGAEPGLAEVRRVLRPNGTLVVVDNDHTTGEFAELLALSQVGNGALDPDATTRWWTEQGATSTTVLSEWRFNHRADFEAVLRIEFPSAVVDDWLARHPDTLGLSYSYALYTLRV